MKKKFHFHTNCVNSTANLINSMVDNAKEIIWETFIKHVDINELKSMFAFTPHLKDDYAVFFYKSIYNGEKCYFMEHSRIEYIFI